MLVPRIIALVIAVPLLILAIVRLTQALAARVGDQDRYGNRQSKPAALRVPQFTVPFGIGVIVLCLVFPSLVGWEAVIVIAILAAYYAMAITWWHFGLHAGSGDWRRALPLWYLIGLTYGFLFWSYLRVNGPLSAALVAAVIIAAQIVRSRLGEQRPGSRPPERFGPPGMDQR